MENHSAEHTLKSAMRYVEAYYGSTLADHYLALALIEVQKEAECQKPGTTNL